MRLAQRKAELEGSQRNDDETGNKHDSEKTQEQEEREGHQRLRRMFDDTASDSDEGSSGSLEDEIVGRLDVEDRSNPEEEQEPEGSGSDKKDDGYNMVIV